jgi:hypothetical protein
MVFLHCSNEKWVYHLVCVVMIILFGHFFLFGKIVLQVFIYMPEVIFYA